MDIIIMILMTALMVLIYRGARPSVAIPLWTVTAVLTLLLLRIHMTSPLGLEF